MTRPAPTRAGDSPRRRIRRPQLVVLAAAGLAAALPGPATAQDLEVEALRRGTSLPEAYYRRKAEDPLAFELPNGLWGGRESLPPVRAPGLVPQPARAPFLGTARLPVVLALFSDSPDPWVGPQDVEQALFTGPAPRGTVTEFYSEASLGKFTVTGDVSPWVRTSLTRAQAVGAEYGLGEDARVGEYLLEALDSLDADVDFRQYDNDGPDGIPDSGDDDGVVDAVVFEFLEVSASCGGPGIWPHRWGISGWTGGEPWTSADMGASGAPVTVDGYIIQGVTECSGTQVQGAETIAHEFGHVLGLPDYYHAVGGITPEHRRWVLGCWDLMAAGSWGCGPVGSNRTAFGPTHLTAWNRHALGWLDFVEVGEVRDTVMELGPIRTTGDALKVPLGPGQDDEFLLVEFRDRQGFDRDLPSAGVLVTRINPPASLRPTGAAPYFASVMEADGDRALLRTLAEGGDRGVAPDLFGTDVRWLGGPRTRTFDGRPTTVTFHDITWSPGGANVRMSTHPEPELVVPEDPLEATAGRPVDFDFLVAGGTMPVEPAGGEAQLVPGLTLGAEDDDRVRLGGAPFVEGTYSLVLAARDAVGRLAIATVELVVGPFAMEVERLASALLGGPAVTEGEAGYLDTNGNGNGVLDVGDMRAWRYR
ncbi:MAG TPA: M6 family metalloprotease domain-containing protein [Longimicrobiales bacterium]|nr:M6 family metalloprotease domain-containing protein [Longimicrobiales bacterium]